MTVSCREKHCQLRKQVKIRSRETGQRFRDVGREIRFAGFEVQNIIPYPIPLIILEWYEEDARNWHVIRWWKVEHNDVLQSWCSGRHYLVDRLRNQTEEIPESIWVLQMSLRISFLNRGKDKISWWQNYIHTNQSGLYWFIYTYIHEGKMGKETFDMWDHESKR